MIKAERLAKRSKDRNISQAELARRVGMTQPAMNQLFTGVSRTSRKIGAIARELNTTPEYLEGMTDDPSESFAGSYFSDEERDWVDILRDIDAEDRLALLRVARSLAGAAAVASHTVHSKQDKYRAGLIEGE